MLSGGLDNFSYRVNDCIRPIYLDEVTAVFQKNVFAVGDQSRKVCLHFSLGFLHLGDERTRGRICGRRQYRERQGAERGGSANLFGAGDEINALVILLILYQVLFLYRLRKERSIPITLIFVRSIHEYQTDHFVRIHAGEQSHVESSEGVTDQHIRWSDAGISQQCA